MLGWTNYPVKYQVLGLSGNLSRHHVTMRHQTKGTCILPGRNGRACENIKLPVYMLDGPAFTSTPCLKAIIPSRPLQQKAPLSRIPVEARYRECFSPLPLHSPFRETHGFYRYPKHVWSPAGGWYSQPANWKGNTAIMFGVIFGITAMAWSVSAEREYRTRFPEAHRFFPSRW